MIGSDDCECVPEKTACYYSLYATCDGSCPPDQTCVAGPEGCRCEPCDLVAPGPIDGVHWPFDKVRYRWFEKACATVYNTYILRAMRMTDSDGNGVADSYGACWTPDLPITEDIFGDPPSGMCDFILVTAENAVGEGPMGWASNSLPRPNLTPCP
jgi:hypothetical protein